MKKTLLVFLSFIPILVAHAQQPPPPPLPAKHADPDAEIRIDEPVSAPSDTGKIFTAVEQEPGFPGGISRFYQYLGQNIRYPADAVKKHKEGKVFVIFAVENSGYISNAKVLKGVSPDIDAEALRVVSASPRWTPAIQNGRPVRVRFSIGINFSQPKQDTAADRRRMDSILNLPADKKIFTAVEQQPSYPGGMGKFYDYIAKNLKYPAVAKENNIKGQVSVTFVVERDGSLAEARVIGSLSPETDAEAIRLIKECPKWNPGMQNGRAVRVQYALPIKFVLPQ